MFCILSLVLVFFMLLIIFSGRNSQESAGMITFFSMIFISFLLSVQSQLLLFYSISIRLGGPFTAFYHALGSVFFLAGRIRAWCAIFWI